MKKAKKAISVLLSACLLAGVFSGCGGKTDEGAANPPASATGSSSGAVATGEKQKLVIWEHSPQFEAPLKAIIAEFEKNNPDIDCEYQVKTSDQYYNLLATAIQAGEAPDLFWTNGTATGTMKSYVDQKVIMDITEKVDLSIFSDQTKSISRIEGRDYASPTASVDGKTVFYNKDIFAKLGLSVPKTFSEFEAMLPKIYDAGIIPISFCGSDPWAVLFHFEPVLAAMSLDWLDESAKGDVQVNDPRVAAAYNKMLDWADKGYYGKGFMGVDEGGALLAFSKGEAAMCIEGTWNVLTIQENNPDLNFGAFNIPTEKGVRPLVETNACGLSISNSTKYPEAAIKFLNYYASVEAQSIWVKNLNAVPGIKEIVSEDAIINEIVQRDVVAASFYTILGDMAAPDQNPRKVWEEDQTKVMSKGVSVDEFLNTLESMTR